MKTLRCPKDLLKLIAPTLYFKTVNNYSQAFPRASFRGKTFS